MAKTSSDRAFVGAHGELPIRQDDEVAKQLAMLIEGETTGRPLAEVLEEFGHCRSSYYEKRARYLEEGLAGLQQRPPGPRGPWRRSYDVVRRIVTARLEDPGRSATAIAAALEKQGFEVSVRSVERTLSDFGLTRGKGDPP